MANKHSEKIERKPVIPYKLIDELIIKNKVGHVRIDTSRLVIGATLQIGKNKIGISGWIPLFTADK